MRKLLVVLFAVSCLSSGGQTYIKTNALYWLGLLPNVGVETRLGHHFTFEGEVMASLWESVGDRPYLATQVIAGVRWYPKQAFRGFYVGADAAFDAYKLSKWDQPTHLIQQGVGMYYGLTVGYQLPIGKRWNMDFYAGGGWHLGWYYGTDLRTGERYVDWNKSGEWIPYKLGVTFAYRLTSNKRMEHKGYAK